MSLNIGSLEQEGVSVLSLNGKLVMGEESAELQRAIESLMGSGQFKIILDCRQLTAIDEAGLGTIVDMTTKARESKGQLAIAELHPSHLQLLVVLRLEAQFKIYPDRQSAIDSFFPDRRTETYDVLSFVRSIESQNEPGSAGSTSLQTSRRDSEPRA